MEEMNLHGKKSLGSSNMDTWTLRSGTKIMGTANEESFHVDRIVVPEDKRRRGESKKALKILGKAADKANSVLTTFGMPDDDDYHDKWVRTMREYGGFEVDIKTVQFLTEMEEEDIREGDKKWPRDEMIRFPRKARV